MIQGDERLGTVPPRGRRLLERVLDLLEGYVLVSAPTLRGVFSLGIVEQDLSAGGGCERPGSADGFATAVRDWSTSRK
jgi:hypothetical protein